MKSMEQKNGYKVAFTDIKLTFACKHIHDPIR